MDIKKYVRKVRGGLNQKDFAALVWPGDDPVLARNRIAKYERGFARPSVEAFIRIQEIEQKLKKLSK